MKIYEYKCTSCDAVFEEQHAMGEAPPITTCPECDVVAKRYYSPVGFVLKGPGDHWPTQQTRRKKQGAKNNEAAGRRMRKNRDPIKPLSQG